MKLARSHAPSALQPFAFTLISAPFSTYIRSRNSAVYRDVRPEMTRRAGNVTAALVGGMSFYVREPPRSLFRLSETKSFASAYCEETLRQCSLSDRNLNAARRVIRVDILNSAY